MNITQNAIPKWRGAESKNKFGHCWRNSKKYKSGEFVYIMIYIFLSLLPN
jgi:hypothetical protein